MNKSINMKKLKKLNKSVFFLFALILSGLVFSACQSDDPIKVRNQSIQKLYKNGSVKIAVSNSFEYNKSQMWNGVLLAQEKINKEKLLPVNIELVKYDDGGDSVKGITTAYDITSDPEICAVIGHGYSDISLVVLVSRHKNVYRHAQLRIFPDSYNSSHGSRNGFLGCHLRIRFLFLP